MDFLDRRAIVAGCGYSRWLAPPAAIAVHMCIGEVYGFSVFNGPLTKVLGISRSIPDRDWTIPQVGWVYSIALFMLGVSAAVGGKWVERAGPRKAMVASAACFCGGLLVAAWGVRVHQLWLLCAGYGVIGGIGLGLGYIAPVSTLMKWFPDRPGMATGMAIMGFGGGALIGSPLGVQLMERFRSPTSVGVAETFASMAGLYACWMAFGAWIVRVPSDDWTPAGRASRSRPPRPAPPPVGVDAAWRTRQFWLLWLVLCLNVTAGIGILGQASLMCQDMFGVGPAIGGGFAGLLSIFNLAGRFFWSSVSDRLGRRTVYSIFFVLGALLYCLIPETQRAARQGLFVAVTMLIISMYGGGFAAIPAYLRDLFGTGQVGAIHGRLITAWSAAALIGPQLINYLSAARKQAGVARAESYNTTMYLMATLLLVGWAANLSIRPVSRPDVHPA